MTYLTFAEEHIVKDAGNEPKVKFFRKLGLNSHYGTSLQDLLPKLND